MASICAWLPYVPVAHTACVRQLFGVRQIRRLAARYRLRDTRRTSAERPQICLGTKKEERYNDASKLLDVWMVRAFNR